jgi:error-prone DNA polymerase
VQLQPVGRFASIEQVVQRTGLRRDELTTLADIGALNAFTHERRSALWQVERAVRPAGELFGDSGSGIRDSTPGNDAGEREERSPLPTMDDHERLRADYAGMGLTIGPHPMSLRRDDLALRGVLRASDLSQARDGRRVRVAGMVITRQRPGTAKGFVFLTLEDETGVSNVIIRPDLFDRERMTVIRQPFLLVEGVLQHQDGVLSVKADKRRHRRRGFHRRARFLLNAKVLTRCNCRIAGGRRYADPRRLRKRQVLRSGKPVK